MIPITLSDLARWTGGRVVRGSADQTVQSISTDSRTVHPGACFVALVGERFDGHDFALEAAKKGASAVVVSRQRVSLRAALPETVGVIAVADTTRALMQIAGGYRRRFSIPVVAVTGSNGKTSTKDMIAAVLARRHRVLATQKNYNNEVGLSLTLLQLESSHGVAVVELGMRAKGEIAALARAAAPSIGVVTNVGPVHIEKLGSLEEIASAKAELVEALPEEGVAFLNVDDDRVRAMSRRTRARVVTYGVGPGAAARAINVESMGLEGSRFDLLFRGDRLALTIPVPGQHQVMNAVAAAAVGLTLGVPPDQVQEALATVRLTEMRLAVARLTGGVVLVNDAYNASPLSTAAALGVLAEAEGARRVAILGDMLELGPLAAAAHREIGARAAEAGVDLLVAIGQHREEIAAGARAAGLESGAVVTLADAKEAARLVSAWLQPGDVVLLKASRGVRLERVAEAITAQWGGEPRQGAEAAGEKETSRT